MMLKNLVFTCLLLVPVVCGNRVLAAADKGGPSLYSLIDMGSAAHCISPNSINASGDVVGMACSPEGPWHAFLYTNGTMINLGTLGGSLSQARDINNSGQVVGVSTNGQGKNRAFLYEDGFMTDLGDLLGGPGSESQATGINDRGDIVGSAQTTVLQGSPPQYTWHGFLLGKHGKREHLVDLGILEGTDSSAAAINNHGQIAGRAYTKDAKGALGERAFLYTRGAMINLGTLGGGVSWANAINDRGQVVGMSKNSSGDRRPFLYEDGQMRDLGISAYDGATAINNRGQIVGRGAPGTFQGEGAFLYDNGSTYDLNNLLDPSGAGWTITWPRAINDAGQIAAEARDAQNLRHAVILSPGKSHKMH